MSETPVMVFTRRSAVLSRSTTHTRPFSINELLHLMAQFLRRYPRSVRTTAGGLSWFESDVGRDDFFKLLVDGKVHYFASQRQSSTGNH